MGSGVLCLLIGLLLSLLVHPEEDLAFTGEAATFRQRSRGCVRTFLVLGCWVWQELLSAAGAGFDVGCAASPLSSCTWAGELLVKARLTSKEHFP